MAVARERILIVDDDPQICQILGDRLEASGFSVVTAGDGRAGLEKFREENPDAVFLDLQMPVMDGMQTLQKMRTENPDVPVIILTAFGTLSRAVEAMKLGAYDFLPKPSDPDHLVVVLQKALEKRRLLRENTYLRDQLGGQYRLIVGEDSPMQEVLATAQKVADTDTTVLIEGESGTGKQVLAWVIHNMSQRRNRPFVHVSCTTLSEQLLESDLFGHEKGAFTGAHQMKRGRVELADGGTLFLDEIGDLSPAIQAKLLRFLERSEFERVGGMKTLRVDARVIAATNKHLQDEVNEGRFRADLFFRLNVVNLSIPPLRERPQDIQPLAEHFLEKFSQRLRKQVVGIAPEAMDMLRRYHWPGNVRELENALERAVVLASGPTVTPELLPPQLSATAAEEIAVGLPLDEAVTKFKKNFISKTLRSTGGNQSQAAKILNIQRTYLNRLVKELGLRQ